MIGRINSHPTDLVSDKIINAKGDILVGTADDTINVLSLGANGQILVANSSTATGLEWGTAGSSVTISDSAPISPSSGDLWWESDTGRLKIYYNDGDSSQWVDAYVGYAVSEQLGQSDQVVLGYQIFT